MTRVRTLSELEVESFMDPTYWSKYVKLIDIAQVMGVDYIQGGNRISTSTQLFTIEDDYRLERIRERGVR